MSSKRILSILCLAVVSLTLINPSAQMSAQDTPKTCVLRSGANANQEIAVRYNGRTKKLTVISWNTGNTLGELESALDTPRFEIVEWSPNCQYLVGAVGSGAGKQIAIWDVISYRHVGSRNAPGLRYLLNWSPSNDYLVIQTPQGGVLWHLLSDRQILLNPKVDNYGRSFYRIEWDTHRGELLVVQVGSSNGVTAYHVSDGQQVGFFYIERQRAIVNYRRLDNNHTLLVFATVAEQMGRNLTPVEIALWNRDTKANIQLSTNYEVEIEPGFDVIGNMNSRYFIINRFGGYFARVFIWDLQKPVSNKPYIPNYWLHTFWGADGVRFVDNHTIEVVDWSYSAYSYKPAEMRARRLDLETGKMLFEVTREPYSHCTDSSFQNHKERSLLEWGCSVASFERREHPQWGENNSTYYPPL